MSDQVNMLKEIANELRCQVVRMIYKAGSGHPGGSLSAADIITALYFSELKIDPKRPSWSQRDRFVLSKGHAAPVLYAALAKHGFFPSEELWTLRQLGSRLQGHPDMTKTPGIDATTGSLGLGFSMAGGMAVGGKLDSASYRVYVMLGCGEQQEGQVWEAAMASAHYRLDNLVAIVDYNRLQIDGRNADVMEYAPLAEKWKAFGWHVLEIDGHDMRQILEALATARDTRGSPTVIIAHTIKGKGVSFMEDQVSWHSSSRSALTSERLKQALRDLSCREGLNE
jgi:transketolase